MQAQIHAPRTGYAYNLLDNSDFRNPVNQRGQTSYTGNQYTIDRWRTYSVGATVSVANGYVGINDALMQYVLGIDTAKIYTAAVARPDGSLSVTSGIFGAGFGNVSIGIRCGVTSDLARFLIEGTVFPQIAWAALYEGAYTADTLPPYQPKGYAAELAECQRYFESVNSFYFNAQTNSNFNVFILYKANKRISNPTVTVYDQQGNTGKVSEYEDGTWKPVNVTVYSYVNGFRISGIASTGYATISLKAASSADL